MARAGDTVFDLLLVDSDDDDDLIELDAPTRPPPTSSRHLDMSSSHHALAMVLQRLTGLPRPSNGLVFPSTSTSTSSSSTASTSTSTSASASAQSSQSHPATQHRRPMTTTMAMPTTSSSSSSSFSSSSSSSRPAATASHAPVIDLTEEPDSPPRPARHPRRTTSLRLSPPRLARSDSTVVTVGSPLASATGPDDDIIDLTADSPEHARRRASPSPIHSLRRRDPPPPPLHPRREPPARIRAPTLHNYGVPDPDSFSRSWASLIGSVDFVRQLQQGVNPAAAAAAAAARSYAPAPARPPSPKPPMEPVAPPRDGFTRDTCEDPDEEMVVVCPSCNEELAYDPAESAAAAAAAQGGSRKRKRQPGEHHFWAIKKCGHVYCADCFENRKKTLSGAGLSRASSSSPGTDIRCSVDGCDTKVGSKIEWIGIYL